MSNLISDWIAYVLFFLFCECLQELKSAFLEIVPQLINLYIRALANETVSLVSFIPVRPQ